MRNLVRLVALVGLFALSQSAYGWEAILHSDKACSSTGAIMGISTQAQLNCLVVQKDLFSLSIKGIQLNGDCWAHKQNGAKPLNACQTILSKNFSEWKRGRP